VPEHVSIAYRGANYAIGQGPQFYGIWHASAVHSPPIEWWPLTPEGWTGAWARFASIEAPGTIGPAPQDQLLTHGVTPGSGSGTAAAASSSAAASPELASNSPSATRTSRIGAAVLGLGVLLGIASLFPAYVAGSSLASQPPNLVTHISYLVAWCLSAVLIASGGGRQRAGALLGLGTSAGTLGLFVADLGTPLASGVHLADSGLVLGLLGWLACTVGVLVALRSSPPIHGRNGVVAPLGLARDLGRAASQEIVPLVALVLAAIGTAIAFAPSWDSFKLTTTTGVSEVVTAGNAFANPGPVILGNVLVMVAIVAVAVVAVLWRPTRLGGALAAGAIVPMVAQVISAFVLLREPTSPLQFGISQSQAGQLGLTISNGLTPMFWVFCAFVATMILLSAWMLIFRESTPQQAFQFGGQVSAAPTGVTGAPGQPTGSQPAGS
jgi:hypothetical protein